MGNFGSAFWDSYNATKRTMEEHERTGLLKNADQREAEKWDEHKQIVAKTNQIANITRDYIESEWGEGQKTNQPVQPVRGLQSGPAAPPAAAAPSAPEPAPTPMQTPADYQAGPGAAAPPPAPAAPAPKKGALAPDAGPVPAPAAEADVMPRTAAAAAAPVPQSDINGYINRARKFTNKVMPLLIETAASANPVKAGEYALMMGNAKAEDRMTKIIALGSVLGVNNKDPGIGPLIEEVFPGAQTGSWVPHEPNPNDPSGSKAYGHFVMTDPNDGKEKTVPIYPEMVKSMMQSTLSPKGWLDYNMKEREAANQEAGTAQQGKNMEALRKDAEIKQKFEEKKWDDAAPDRASTRRYHDAAAAHARAGAEAQGDIKQQTLDNKMANESLNAILRLKGVKPEFLQGDKDLQNEVAADIYNINATAAMNNMKPSAATASQLAAVMQQMRSGTMKPMYDKATGRYGLPTGDPKNPMMQLPESAVPPNLRIPNPQGPQPGGAMERRPPPGAAPGRAYGADSP